MPVETQMVKCTSELIELLKFKVSSIIVLYLSSQYKKNTKCLEQAVRVLMVLWYKEWIVRSWECPALW